MTVTWLKIINLWRVLDAMSTDKERMRLNFVSNLNIFFQMNMYTEKWFYRLYK